MRVHLPVILASSLFIHGSLAQCTEDFEYVTIAGQECRDGSPAAYFYLPPADGNTVNFMIWLGDAELCQSPDGCDSMCDVDSNQECRDPFTRENATVIQRRECIYRELTCSSSLWEDEAPCPTTVLKEFTNFHRVFLPQCTFDWFLGTADTGLFSGASIFDAVIADITLKGYTSNSNLVLGGSRGGAIGALHHASRRIRQTASPHVKVILDSGWFVNSPHFNIREFDNPALVYRFNEFLVRNSGEWIRGARIDFDCYEKFSAQEFEVPGSTLNELPSVVNCFFPNVLLQHSSILRDTPILVVQSQYDLAALAEYGVLNEAAHNDFNDTTSYINNAIQFIEQVGEKERATMQFSTSVTSNLVFFSDSCGDHAPLIPVSTLEVPNHEEDINEAGVATFERLDSTWDGLKIGDRTLKSVVTEFIEGEMPNEVIMERCGSFLCGANCVLEVEAFKLDNNFGEFMIFVTFAMSMGIIGVGCLGFMLTYCQSRRFRSTYKREWKKLPPVVDAKDADPNLVADDDLVMAMADNKNIATLMVRNLSYFAPPRKRGQKYYQILHKVSVVAKAGEVHALMGPSGSGKSTLLDVLAGVRENGVYTGEHYINGMPSNLRRGTFLKQWLKNKMSYVRQQDVLFPLITVKEHLIHAAWLMLPESLSAAEKVSRVRQVALLLGLGSTMDTLCGDGGVRIEGGISGGQRRRVSVATQLLKLPAVLVLDEPTSGLDSTNALLLMKVLNRLAHEAKVNVFMTIHQPRREIFQLVDRLTILLQGFVSFCGTPEQAGQFFGVNLETVNIGDDVLDMLEEYKDNERQLKRIRRRYRKGVLGKSVDRLLHKEESYLTEKMSDELQRRLRENAKAEGRVSWEKVVSTRLALKVLFSRTMLRGGFDIRRTATVAGAGGLLVGTVFYGKASYTISTALAYLIVATMAFLQATFLGGRYQLEKGMWSHEKDAGTMVSYVAFLSSLYLRNIVTSTIEGLAFAVPAYFIGGLNTDNPIRVINFLILLVLVALTVIAQITLVEINYVRRGGITGPDLRKAALVNMTLIGVGALFNGFIIQLEDIPVELSWIPYLMVTYWGFIGIVVNNFNNFAFECTSDVLLCATDTGDNFVRSFGYDRIDVYQAIFALCLLFITFHVLGTANFYFRFVKTKNKLKKTERQETTDEEEDATPYHGYTEADRKRGFVGDTMDVLVNNNLGHLKRSRSRNNVAASDSRSQATTPTGPSGNGTVARTASNGNMNQYGGTVATQNRSYQPAMPSGGYQQPVPPSGGYQQPMPPGYQQPMAPGGYQASVGGASFQGYQPSLAGGSYQQGNPGANSRYQPSLGSGYGMNPAEPRGRGGQDPSL